jgi:hypothetical protein
MDWIEVAITAPRNQRMVWFDVPKKTAVIKAGYCRWKDRILARD